MNGRRMADGALGTAPRRRPEAPGLPLGRWCALAVSGVLAACASSPPPGADTPAAPSVEAAPAVELPPQATAYEVRQRDRALALTRQGRLADAALVWEVLATIRPNVPEYRDRLAELRQQIDSGVSDRVQRAEQAAARGQLDGATQFYLQALALQPDNLKAADGLRAVERERNKRTYLGKLSRNTLTRRAMAEGEVGSPPLDATAESAAGAVSPAPAPAARTAPARSAPVRPPAPAASAPATKR